MQTQFGANTRGRSLVSAELRSSVWVSHTGLYLPHSPIVPGKESLKQHLRMLGRKFQVPKWLNVDDEMVYELNLNFEVSCCSAGKTPNSESQIIFEQRKCFNLGGVGVLWEHQNTDFIFPFSLSI